MGLIIISQSVISFNFSSNDLSLNSSLKRPENKIIQEIIDYLSLKKSFVLNTLLSF